MSGQILYSPAPNTLGPRRTMMFQLAIPESCSDEASKVANFRKHRQELEQEMREVDRVASRHELLSKARLVTAIVMESSISFLDLAAAMFNEVNPAAANAATAGVAAVRATKTTGDYATGQINGAQWTVAMGQQGLNAVATHKKLDTLAAQAMLNQAKTQMAAVALVVETTSGTSRAEAQKAAADFASSAVLNQLSTIERATTDGGMAKTSGVLKTFSLFEGIYSATTRYQEALDSHFDQRIDDKIWAAQYRRNQTVMLRDLMARIDSALSVSAANLEACIAAQGRPKSIRP